MFAVVRTGGKQYKVSPDDVIVVEKLPGEAGSSLNFSDVLMVSDGTTTAVGKPVVAGAKVAATVIEQDHAAKIVVLKFKRRHKYRRTAGHRQEVTVLRITEISAPGMTTAKAEPKPKKVAAPKVEAAEAEGAKVAPKKTAAKNTGRTKSKTATKAAKPPKAKGGTKAPPKAADKGPSSKSGSTKRKPAKKK